jgi:putative transposase
MVNQFIELTDSQWDEVKVFLGIERKRKNCLRSIVNGILWLLRTGAQWRNLDSKFPKWNLCYYYFSKWNSDGSLQRINQWLNELERMHWDKEASPSLMAVDSQSVKLAPFIAEERGLDGNKKVNGRKRQIMVDTLGLVHAVSVHAANGSDTIYGCELLEQVRDKYPRLEKILVDGTYKGTFIEEAKRVLEVKVEVASKPESTKGFVPIKKRWVVERTFGWFNFFRRLAKDYEQKTENSAAWIFWANSFLILNRIEYWTK